MAYPTDGSRYHTAAPNGAVPSTLINSIQDAQIEANKLNQIATFRPIWEDGSWSSHDLSGGYITATGVSANSMILSMPSLRLGGSYTQIKIKYYVAATKSLWIAAKLVLVDNSEPAAAPAWATVVDTHNTTGDSDALPYWGVATLDMSGIPWTTLTLPPEVHVTVGDALINDRICPPVAYGYLFAQP